jgi:hypothetical protein
MSIYSELSLLQQDRQAQPARRNRRRNLGRNKIIILAGKDEIMEIAKIDMQIERLKLLIKKLRAKRKLTVIEQQIKKSKGDKNE